MMYWFADHLQDRATALHIACAMGHEEIVNVLLRARANIDIQISVSYM